MHQHTQQNHKNSNTQTLETWKIDSRLVIIVVRFTQSSSILQVAECDDQWTYDVYHSHDSGVILTFRVEKLRTQTKIDREVQNTPLKLFRNIPGGERHLISIFPRWPPPKKTRKLTLEPKELETRSIYVIPSICGCGIHFWGLQVNIRSFGGYDMRIYCTKCSKSCISSTNVFVYIKEVE